MPYPEPTPNPPQTSISLILLIEQSGTVFGINLSNLGACNCRGNQNPDDGTNVSNGINAYFAERSWKDSVTGLWHVRKVGFSGESQVVASGVRFMDDPPAISQSGSLGNAELASADGLKVYFSRRKGQDVASGLWNVDTITSNGKVGKSVAGVFVINSPPSGSGAVSGNTSFDGSGNVTLTTTSNIAGLQLGSTVGSTPGTASAGTATTAARSDHVHPKQELEKYWFGTAAELPDQRSDDVIYYVLN